MSTLLKAPTNRKALYDHTSLRLANDLSESTLDLVGIMLLKRNKKGCFVAPTKSEIANYLNELAAKREIKHSVLNGVYEPIYLFTDEDVVAHIKIMESEVIHEPEVIVIPFSEEGITPEDDIPVEICSIKELCKLPNLVIYSIPCVYFLCKNGKVVYVGQSINLAERISKHKRSGKVFDSVFYIKVPFNKLNQVESALISYLKPPLNLTALKENEATKSVAESLSNYESIKN